MRPFAGLQSSECSRDSWGIPLKYSTPSRPSLHHSPSFYLSSIFSVPSPMRSSIFVPPSPPALPQTDPLYSSGADVRTPDHKSPFSTFSVRKKTSNFPERADPLVIPKQMHSTFERYNVYLDWQTCNGAGRALRPCKTSQIEQTHPHIYTLWNHCMHITII